MWHYLYYYMTQFRRVCFHCFYCIYTKYKERHTMHYWSKQQTTTNM